MEIKYLRGLRHSFISHVSRSQNNASDRLASFARVEDRTMTWIASRPSEVLEIIKSDCKDIVIALYKSFSCKKSDLMYVSMQKSFCVVTFC